MKSCQFLTLLVLFKPFLVKYFAVLLQGLATCSVSALLLYLLVNPFTLLFCKLNEE